MIGTPTAITSRSHHWVSLTTEQLIQSLSEIFFYILDGLLLLLYYSYTSISFARILTQLPVMADDSMPPRPETEFDFNFPDGIDSEDDIPNVGQNDYGSLDGLPDSSKPSGNHNSNSHYANQQDDDYSTAMKGFSDDEAGDETFDSSWTTNRVENNNFMIKKSPRRLNADDADDEDSPKVKRPRQSLFGGPDRGIEECGLDQPTEDYQSDHDTINTPGKGIRNCMSSINLGEEDGASQSFSLGFGLELSDKGSMSSRTSPAPSEGSIIIPPDDQVSRAIGSDRICCHGFY